MSKAEESQPEEVSALRKEDIAELLKQQARDREIELAEVFNIFKIALARILHRNNNRSGEFRVSVDPETYEMAAEQIWVVISDDEPIEDVTTQKTLEIALEMDPDAQVGGEVTEAVTPPDLNKHTNALTFKYQFNLKIRDAQRRKQVEELLARGEKLVSGTVRRVEHSSGDVIIEVHQVDCRLKRIDSIPREILRPGDRVRALIKEIVDDTNRGVQIYLTRGADEFLHSLFEREVPEIEKGVLEIVNVARQPGYRSKVAVRSFDTKVDPVGTCVGIRGSRVQSVTADLAGERVDIVPFEEDETDFVLRALAPAEVTRFRFTGERSCDVIVDKDNLAQAIGKEGTNVRLAAKLTGWQINITDSDSSDEMENERMRVKREYFMQRLDIDESVASILYDEGFDSVESIAEVDLNELKEIEGFDEDIAQAVHDRAVESVATAEAELVAKQAQIEPKLAELVLDSEVLRALITADVMKVADLADLSSDELVEMCGSLPEEDAIALIMKARNAADTPATKRETSKTIR